MSRYLKKADNLPFTSIPFPHTAIAILVYAVDLMARKPDLAIHYIPCGNLIWKIRLCAKLKKQQNIYNKFSMINTLRYFFQWE